MFQVRLASRLLAYRGFATAVLRNGPAVVEGKARNVHPVYAKMKETSKVFQVNNGRSVNANLYLSNSMRRLQKQLRFFKLNPYWQFFPALISDFSFQVHNKRGGFDDVLFWFIHFMAVVVFCMTVHDIYEFAYPEKKED